jgi:hypothetical protein
MAKGATESWLVMLIRLYVFEGAAPYAGSFEKTGEQRNNLMAAQADRDSTLTWRKSRASNGGDGCVEVAKSDSSVLLRDSKNRSGAILEISHPQWREFVRRMKADPAA